MNPFILQTAKDYCLDYETVNRIYNQYFNSGLFYEKLEEIITLRSL